MWQLISDKEKVIDLCESDRNLPPHKIVVKKYVLKKEEWKYLWKLKIQERLELNLWNIAWNIILT